MRCDASGMNKRNSRGFKRFLLDQINPDLSGFSKAKDDKKLIYTDVPDIVKENSSKFVQQSSVNENFLL